MDTLEVGITCSSQFKEILWAEMSFAGYESMMETEVGFNAYIPEDLFDQSFLDELKDKYAKETSLEFVFDLIKKKNWNEEWEKNFQPVIVEDQIHIRASFHEHQPKFPWEIVINPKMSFGTGHHDTTYLVLKEMLNLDFDSKTVLDIGCGTGILSIMAKKLGASKVIGIDVDPWSVENSIENAELNGCDVEFFETELEKLSAFQYDYLLANINLNYHLQTFSSYNKFLSREGVIIMSGFFHENSNLIIESAQNAGLEWVSQSQRNHWSVITFRHKN